MVRYELTFIKCVYASSVFIPVGHGHALLRCSPGQRFRLLIMRWLTIRIGEWCLSFGRNDDPDFIISGKIVIEVV